MSTRREKIFRCTLVTGSRRTAGLVRAWDRREAAEIFWEDLAATGMTPRGTIEVADITAPSERPCPAGGDVGPGPAGR